MILKALHQAKRRLSGWKLHPKFTPHESSTVLAVALFILSHHIYHVLFFYMINFKKKIHFQLPNTLSSASGKVSFIQRLC